MTPLRREHTARVLNARESMENEVKSSSPVLVEPREYDGGIYLFLAIWCSILALIGAVVWWVL